MNSRNLASFAVGNVVFAGFAAVILFIGQHTLQTVLIVGAFGILIAIYSALCILGEAAVRSPLVVSMVALSAVAFALFDLGFVSLASSAAGYTGPNSIPGFTGNPVIFFVLGSLAYLVAATAYGFVSTAQGVPVGRRIGLLLLLLLAMFPVLDLAGAIGVLIATVLRRRAGVSREQPPASE
jgi:hypothetical protein